MKVITAEINNIGGIANLVIPFSENMNIICGPNGIGKSTILEALSFVFTRHGSDIKKNIRSSEPGTINLVINFDSGPKNFQSSASTSSPLEQTGNYHAELDMRYLIRFNTESILVIVNLIILVSTQAD
ncbi:AAA family ATPase [Citrobacter freundii]|uniref:AAA family ATPase n=1 Tax=Citrobacter freundii TaxID=546 RepID=UPI003A855B2D